MMKKNGVWYVKNQCKNGAKIVMEQHDLGVGTVAPVSQENVLI